MRSTQTKYWISTYLGLLAAPALAAPNDIEIIANAADAIDTHIDLEGEKAEEQFIDLFTGMVHDRALAIGDEQGITDVAELNSKAFKAHTLEWVKPMVSKAAKTGDETKRKEAWYELLRIASTDANAHALLASWMDFDAPAAYLADIKRGAPPRISSQVSASSSDERLKVYEPQISLGGEVGGAGQGNGVLDAGEWVNLGLAIYNDSNRPFFSSSAWMVSGHECAWVPKAYEIEVQELPAQATESTNAGEAKEPTTEPLNSWVYLSDTCEDMTVVPLQVEVLDTHRAPETPIVLSVNLNVRNRGKAVISDYLIDTDQPGWSDNAPMPEIDVEREFELSHGLTTSSANLLSARAAWAIRKDLVQIFKETRPANEQLLPIGEGRFIAGDDLDLQTHKTKEYDLAVQAIADELRWDSLEDARAWFATDTEILFETPDPSIEAPPPPPPPEVCDNYLDDDEDGKHDCQDTDCKDEPVCNVPSPVEFQALYEMMSANASIVANPAKPSIPGAIDAVQPGYELLLDKDQLAQQYQCLIDQIPLKDCGKVICPECVEEQEEKEEKPVVDTGRDPAVAYVYRNYFTIPLHWNPQEAPAFNNCEDERDNDLDQNADCADTACPCSETECDDELDNDSDGLTDCEDVEDCGDKSVCIPVEYSEDVCDDGIDNDDDGLVDCADLEDCNADGLKSERREQCNDGIDNDCDGQIDGEDSGCQTEARFGRLDLNIGASTIATNSITLQDGTEFLSWTVAGGPIPAFGLRYVFGFKADSILRYMLAAERTPRYPVVHGGDSTYGSWTISGGLASHVDFMDGRLYIEPHVLMSLVDRDIAPEADGSPLFSNHTRTTAVDIDLEVHFQLYKNIGIYAGGGYQVITPVVVNGETVLSTDGLGGQFGLTYLFGQK